MKTPLGLVALTALFYGCNHQTAKRLVAYPIKHEQRLEVNLSYNPTDADKRIDAYFQYLHTHRGFNGNVLIAKKGKIVYENSFGYANYIKKIPLSIHSRFQLASISKQFTAVGIMILKDQKKISFEDTVGKFFPDFPYKNISIRMLLTHRSGLPNYQYYSENVWKDKSKAMTNQDLMAMLAKEKPTAWAKPDNHFLYNNINYAVLAAIVEKVTGQSMANFMHDNVFKKVGMDNTVIYSKASGDTLPTNLIGYERSFRRRSDPNWLDGVVGDKGVYTTVGDLFKWDQMLYTDALISKKTLLEAFTGYSKVVKGHFNYGFGWRIFQMDKEKIVYHTGWWHGYKNIFVRDIGHQTTVIILSNLFNSSINELDDLYGMLNIPPIRQSAY